MNRVLLLLVTTVFIVCCKSTKIDLDVKDITSNNDTIVITFGSCNDQNKENKLWSSILSHSPDLWIWCGDNIYSDTEDMAKMKADYDMVLNNDAYKKLLKQVEVTGTWDDHDYGANDAGVEYPVKKLSQQQYLDFFNVPKGSLRRHREGVYHSKNIKNKEGMVKIIVLDTRYFRTALTVSKTSKRYKANSYGEGTILGEKQWKWLENELLNSKADFNIIVSSIQFLSHEHGFETWGNFPHEVDKFKTIIRKAKPRGVLFISGDRHISEFSKTTISGINYPLLDFTSSGLTNAYKGFTSEPNMFRTGKVISENSFGVLKIDITKKAVLMEMRGERNILQQKLLQVY